MTTTDTTEPWHLDIDNAWYGELIVDPAETITADGETRPTVMWRMTTAAVDSVVHALAALDDIGDVMRAHSGEGPNGNQAITAALQRALERMVEAGQIRPVGVHNDMVWHDDLVPQ